MVNVALKPPRVTYASLGTSYSNNHESANHVTFPSDGTAYAQRSGASKYCGALGGFADQNLVGHRCGASADAEQGVKGSMPCAAPIEAEHEFIEVVLKVGFPQPVIDAQAPALEV